MSRLELQEYVKNYSRAVFRLRALGRSAPSEERLARFEDSIGFSFPEEFREFMLSPLAGLCFEVCDDLWPRSVDEDEDEDWQKLYNVTVFAIGPATPHWLALHEELAKLPEEESDLIPFMARGADSSRFCFDLDHQIVLWSPEDGSREVINQPFSSLLLSELKELEVRWERYKEAASKKKKKKKKAKRAKAGSKS